MPFCSRGCEEGSCKTAPADYARTKLQKKTLLNGLPHCDECSISVSRFTAKISDIRFQEKSAPPSFFLIIQQKQP
jgi:hypothetical protein